MYTMKLTKTLSTDDYRGKRILVTGSSGYLANNLISLLSNVECDITRIARTGAILSLVQGNCRVTDIIADLADAQVWQRALKNIDIVFHFAAQTNIVNANENPIEDRNLNVLPLLSMLETCRKLHYHPMIVLASTVSIYGMTEKLPVNETCADQPMTIYDLHKLQCEQYLQHYIRHDYVLGTTLRLANVYGPGVHTSTYGRGILNKMVKNALTDEPLILYGDGNCYRDYIYIDDVSTAFLAAGLSGQIVNGKTYIIASGQAFTANDIAAKVSEHVQQATGKLPTILRQATSIDADNRNFAGDIHAFCSDVAWQPNVNLDVGILQTIKATQ